MCFRAVYLGKETNVACHLMDGLAEAFKENSLSEEADFFRDDAARIRQHMQQNADIEEDAEPIWCD